MPFPADEGGFFREDPGCGSGVLGEVSSARGPALGGQVLPDRRSESAHLVAYGEGCSRCRNLTVNQEWRAAFGVALCNECRLKEDLLTKVRCPGLMGDGPWSGDGLRHVVLVCRGGCDAALGLGWPCGRRGMGAEPAKWELLMRHRRTPQTPLRSRVQGAAKKQYLLNDREMQRLGSLQKRNPQHADWQPMRLYMRSQVERLSRDKHGSLERVQEAQRAQFQERLQQRIRVSGRVWTGRSLSLGEGRGKTALCGSG